jgi:hypothetical protein
VPDCRGSWQHGSRASSNRQWGRAWNGSSKLPSVDEVARLQSCSPAGSARSVPAPASAACCAAGLMPLMLLPRQLLAPGPGPGAAAALGLLPALSCSSCSSSDSSLKAGSWANGESFVMLAWGRRFTAAQRLAAGAATAGCRCCCWCRCCSYCCRCWADTCTKGEAPALPLVLALAGGATAGGDPSGAISYSCHCSIAAKGDCGGCPATAPAPMPPEPKGKGVAAAKGEGSAPPYGPSPHPPLEVAPMEQAPLDPAPARLPGPAAAGRRRSAGGLRQRRHVARAAGASCCSGITGIKHNIDGAEGLAQAAAPPGDWSMMSLQILQAGGQAGQTGGGNAQQNNSGNGGGRGRLANRQPSVA